MNCVPLIFALLAVSSFAAPVEQNRHELRFNKATGDYRLTTDKSFGDLHASADYNSSFYTVGWDRLTVEPVYDLLQGSDSHWDHEKAYYAAGMIEGLLTWDRIYYYYKNNVLRKVKYADENQTAIWTWIDEHLKFMETQAYKDKNSSTWSSFDKQLALLIQQVKGIHAGYNAGQQLDKYLSFREIFLISFQWEYDDVRIATASTKKQADFAKPGPQDGHCSAIVKVTSDDVFFTHVTWTYLESMQRMYKTYKFGDVTISMSSFPGVIHSIDDWYMTSHQLAVMETTNIIYNTSITKEFVVPHTVSEFYRVMIANYLATEGQEWMKLFSHLNSGTYCNQWMVLDMKKVQSAVDATTGKIGTLPNNTFWVGEQLPGSVTTGDQTDHLNTETYWASYNIPFYKNVYKLSGNAMMEELFGSYYSYTKYTRPQIFKRDQANVTKLEDVQTLMRYNNYKHDPLSIIPNCSGAANNTCYTPYSSMLAIASRGDLMPAGGMERYGVLASQVAQQDLAAVDAKITSFTRMKNGKQHGVVICGPTSVQQPAFRWSTSPFNMSISHEKLPDLYDFPWMHYSV